MLESRLMRRLGVLTSFSILFALILFAQTASEVEITAEPSHHLALENQYVRVFKVEVAPRASTLMHRHRYDYIFVTLGTSHAVNEVAGKPPVTLKLQDGETWIVPGGFAHVAKNLSDQPFRNITIELLQDKKSRKSTSSEDRGLHILNGGTEDNLFVKDGVRTSEFQLNPAGIVSKHRETGPRLVVAVTDLNLRGEGAGKDGPIQLKAGDIAWIKGGLTRILTNASQQKAKFITLEFL
jgi:quercetin dioxygenase-like cupin family protein